MSNEANEILHKIDLLEYHTHQRMITAERPIFRTREFFADLRKLMPSNLLMIEDMLEYSKDIYMYLDNERNKTYNNQ